MARFRLDGDPRADSSCGARYVCIHFYGTERPLGIPGLGRGQQRPAPVA